MTLEHEGRVSIQGQQVIVVRLVEQAGAFDLRDVAFPLRARIDKLERDAAVDQVFELRRGQLPDQRRDQDSDGSIGRCFDSRWRVTLTISSIQIGLNSTSASSACNSVIAGSSMQESPVMIATGV